jgi:uncharacterized protein YbjT (DUF2867 family)
MRVAVAGGTGVVGTHVVEALEQAGHETVVLARSKGVDVASGQGLGGALAGASAVIDCSNVATMKASVSEAFFAAATRNLLAAGKNAGVRHYVALSIVGIDRVDLGYYRGKLVQEQFLLADSRPASVLRATQFHEFAGQLLDRMRGPIVVTPRMRMQPIAAREVGYALADLAVGDPVGMAPDLAGPREEALVDLVRQVLRVRAQRRLVVPVRLPGPAGRAMAGGGLLPQQPGPRGEQTFAQYLAGLESAVG